MSYIHLHRACHDLVFEHERDRNEDKVEQEHSETETLVHLPPETGDGHDDEQQHHEQDGYRAHHAGRVHLHGLPVDDAVQQPRHW